MKRSLFVALTATAVLAAPALAVAQAAAPTNRMPPLPGRMTESQSIQRFEGEEQRRRLAADTDAASRRYSEERLELARRVAVLVEEHKCDEARAMANAAGDRQMALRIRRTCR